MDMEGSKMEEPISILAVDPGVEGGLAHFHLGRNRRSIHADIGYLSRPALANHLYNYTRGPGGPLWVVIEDLKGASGNKLITNFGECLGMALMASHARARAMASPSVHILHPIRVALVSPQRWQKPLDLPKASSYAVHKRALHEKAKQIAGQSWYVPRAAADAFLIGWWAMSMTQADREKTLGALEVDYGL